MVIACGFAVTRNLTKSSSQLRIIGEDGAAVAVAAQWLAGKERRASNSREAAGSAAVEPGAKALRCVFDHRHAVSACDAIDGGKIGAETIEGDRNDRPGPCRDCRLQQGGIESIAVGIDIYVDRPRPQ